MQIAVIIPTYNEKENIENLVWRIRNLKVQHLGVIIVDDNSPDGTGKVADKLAKKYPGEVDVVHRAGKLGLGTAYIAGMKFAMQKKVKIVLTMDGDFSHDPAEIPKLLKSLELYEVDVVIGSRHVKGGQILGFGWFRHSLTRSAQFLARWILGLPVHDSTSAFRVYRTDVLKAISVETVKSSGYSFLIELIYRIHKQGYKIYESPITFGLRNAGESKVSQDEIVRALKTVWRLKTS